MNILKWLDRERIPRVQRLLTRMEVAKHNKLDDCWIIIEQVVYDVTVFIGLHPGGMKSILDYAGRDCSIEFRLEHSYINPGEMLFNEITGFVID